MERLCALEALRVGRFVVGGGLGRRLGLALRRTPAATTLVVRITGAVLVVVFAVRQAGGVREEVVVVLAALLCALITVLAINLIGDGLRDVLDPKQRTLIEARRKQ